MSQWKAVQLVGQKQVTASRLVHVQSSYGYCAIGHLKEGSVEVTLVQRSASQGVAPCDVLSPAARRKEFHLLVKTMGKHQPWLTFLRI